MFGSLSPHKQLQSPKGENARPIEEIRRIRSGLSTSPRGLTSPSKQGKKIEDTGTVQIEISQDDHADRPRFPIRIPVEQMKPKRNYLAQVRKSETTLETRPSTAKQSKTDIHEKPRRTAETAKGRTPKATQSLNKRSSIPKAESKLNTATDAQDLKRIIENIVDYKFKTYTGASNRALETQKSASNLSMDMSMKKRPNSSRRPLSSRASNKKKAVTESIRASSKKERKETEYSRMSQIPQEPIDPEEAKKEQLLRTKKIVIENLKKFSKEHKEKEEKKVEEKQEKTLKREEIRKLNDRIRMKNEKSPVPVEKSLSPVKHKYEWGADQKRLEMKPERKQSGKKWEKKDPEVRRQEIGLSHLNNLEDLALKKAKIESKEKAAKIIKEAEDKYKIKRKEKTEDEKEKLKLLIREQIEKKRKAKLDEKTKTLKEKAEKKKKLEALLKSVAEIQAKDLAEKKEAEKNKPKPVVKKKSKRTFEGSTSSQPNEEDISNNGNRGRVQSKRQASESKRKQEDDDEEENEYEENFEEEEVAEARELNEEDLYMLDELFEKIDIQIESKLLKSGFSKLKAYCFSEQMNRKVEQERARVQQQQQQQQQQRQQQQQAQIKQQQQQSQTQQSGKKSNVSFNNSNQKEKIEVVEKVSAQKQRAVESEKKQKAYVPPPVDDYEIEEEEQEVYISKPLKESNNYSKALPPKQSMMEKGKIKSDTSGKKLEFRDDREQSQEGTGYRIYNAKSAEKYRSSMKENNRREDGAIPPEGVDFDEMLFNLTSEELIKLPYFSIVK